MTREEQLWGALQAGEPVQHVRAFEQHKRWCRLRDEARRLLMRNPHWVRKLAFDR